MNYKIIILEEAKIDYKKSLLWYKNIHQKIAVRFNDSFKESMATLKKDPLMFQIKYDTVRLYF